MHKVRFYPVGNGDTSQIVLVNSKRLLFDFCHRTDGEDPDSPLIDLKKTLCGELKAAKRDYFDVVAFTHGDDDHISNSTEFFWLEHAAKYQDKERIKIKELWVPAGMLLEEGTSDNQSSEVIIWRQEARHRLKEGKDILVFSKPEKLKKWFEDNKLDFESRKHLLIDAGKLVPGFTLQADQVEFFVHSPFIKHTDEGDELRNNCSLIFQVRFEVDGTRTDYFAVGDAGYETFEDIVDATKAHKNDQRLDWHLFKNAHHCSYTALGPDKGDKETEPTPKVEELLRHGKSDAYMVSSSTPISDDKEAYKEEQPPHIQARKTYEKYLKEVKGRKLLVTMEEPNASHPAPIEFEITGQGLRLSSESVKGAAAIISSYTPRAG
jgi:hypothetical protein